MLQSMGSQGVRHDLVTEEQQKGLDEATHFFLDSRLYARKVAVRSKDCRKKPVQCKEQSFRSRDSCVVACFLNWEFVQ